MEMLYYRLCKRDQTRVRFKPGNKIFAVPDMIGTSCVFGKAE